MKFFHLHPRASLEAWGYIPGFLDEQDPRSAQEQFNANYRGGFHPFSGHTLGEQNELHYPGDPPQYPISIMRFREERIFLYPGDWVCIIQPNGSHVIARMD